MTFFRRQRTRKFARVWCWLCLILLLAACAKDDEDVSNPTEAGYSWTARPVLIDVQKIPWHTPYVYASGLTPGLIVYADGRVVGTQWHSGGSRSIWEATLSTEKLCQLLFQIDSLGFFDFPQSEYQENLITDADTTYVSVWAWRSNTIIANALGGRSGLENEDAMVPLYEAYQYLSTFKPPNSKPYQPERVVLMIHRMEDEIATEAWPASLPGLKELAGDLVWPKYREVLIEGEEATEVNTFFQEDVSRLYFSDGETYRVTLRPLFPLEVYEESTRIRRAQFERWPRGDLTCNG